MSLGKSRYKEILLATGNKSKKERAEFLFKASGLKVKVYMPSDLGLTSIDVSEEGDLEENAIAKAKVYLGKTDMPIIGIDTALFIDGEKIDPLKPKRNALDGKDESEFTQEEIAEKMITFWKSIAEKHGGEVSGYWHNLYAMILPNGSTKIAVSRRDIVLTNEVHGDVDILFPLRAMYKPRATGTYAELQTPEEELLELQPIIDAYKKLLLE